MQRPRGVGEAVHHEILLQLVESATRRWLEQRNIGRDDGRVKLLAFGKEGLDGSSADRAAEVAHHVEEARGGTGLRRRDAHHCDRGNRGHHDRLAERSDDVGPEQLRRGIVLIELKVHEAAAGENQEPSGDQQTRVDPPHEQRHQRDHHELR